MGAPALGANRTDWFSAPAGPATVGYFCTQSLALYGKRAYKNKRCYGTEDAPNHIFRAARKVWHPPIQTLAGLVGNWLPQVRPRKNVLCREE